jgi:hypothetical protein
MSDYDRQPPHERQRTTVIETGDRGGGAGGAIALILLLIVVAGIAWFLMRSAGGKSSTSQVGVNISAPKTIKLDLPEKVDVKVPEVKVRTDTSASNTSR